MSLTKKQASKLGRLSWEARKKKNGIKAMKDLAIKSYPHRKRNKNGQFKAKKLSPANLDVRTKEE